MDRPILVLYVEDDADIRELVELAFEREAGIRVITREPLQTVLENIRTAQPDVVLLDVMMPGIDGVTLARNMRADPQLSAIPFIFMTAKAMPKETAALRELGALDVISKPFDVLQLAQQIRNLLQAHAVRPQ